MLSVSYGFKGEKVFIVVNIVANSHQNIITWKRSLVGEPAPLDVNKGRLRELLIMFSLWVNI